MSGACVSLARFAAVEGNPIPTKQTAPFLSKREAATVIISVVLKFAEFKRAAP
jgi:hypothetical protein